MRSDQGPLEVDIQARITPLLLPAECNISRNKLECKQITVITLFIQALLRANTEENLGVSRN